MSDYAEHVVALQALNSEIAKAMRERRYAEADKLCSDAMSRLARLHAWIKRETAP